VVSLWSGQHGNIERTSGCLPVRGFARSLPRLDERSIAAVGMSSRLTSRLSGTAALEVGRLGGGGIAALCAMDTVKGGFSWKPSLHATAKGSISAGSSGVAGVELGWFVRHASFPGELDLCKTTGPYVVSQQQRVAAHIRT
jgi:hypothetical protein